MTPTAPESGREETNSMLPQQKQEITTKFMALEAQIQASNAKISSARNVLCLPVLSENGTPIAIPALLQLGSYLDELSDTDEEIVKFLRLLVNKL